MNTVSVNMGLRAISKIRVKYSKNEPVRFLSHLEVVSAIRQAVRRASLPVCMSSGFSPQPKISFGPPLAVGYTSSCELFDMEMSCRVSPSDVGKLLIPNMSAALSVVSVVGVPVVSKSVELVVNVARYSVEISISQQVAIQKLSDFFSAKEFLVERITDKSKRTIDVRPLVCDMKYADSKIEMLLRFGPKRTAKPDMIIQKIFNLSDDEKIALRINRDKFFYETETGDLRQV